MIQYFLDTNVFDHLLDNNIELTELIKKGEYFTSNIQASEISNIKNSIRREQLLTIYRDLNQKKLLLNSGIWIDDLRWDDEQPWIDEVGETAKNLVGNSKNKPWKDALIGEIAKINNLVLVSGDKTFLNKAKSQNVNVLITEDFIKEINKSG